MTSTATNQTARAKTRATKTGAAKTRAAKTPLAKKKAAATIDMRSFDESLPMALLRAREATMRRFRPILADHDLTEQQWRVLRALSAATEPMDVGDLAETTFLLGPSLSRILVNLDERGLITRRSDPADQRRSLIELTRGGTRLVARIAPRSEAEYGEIERLLGPKQLQSLFELLAALTASGPENESETDHPRTNP